MQAAGDLVAPASELASRVEHGEDHLEGGAALLGLDPGGDTATVVLHRDRTVGVQSDQDAVRLAGQRLVDRVVDDLPNEVMEAAVVGRPDEHTGAAADRLQALQDLDLVGVVGHVGTQGSCLEPATRAPTHVEVTHFGVTTSQKLG